MRSPASTRIGRSAFCGRKPRRSTLYGLVGEPGAIRVAAHSMRRYLRLDPHLVKGLTSLLLPITSPTRVPAHAMRRYERCEPADAALSRKPIDRILRDPCSGASHAPAPPPRSSSGEGADQSSPADNIANESTGACYAPLQAVRTGGRRSTPQTDRQDSAGSV